MAKLTSDIDLLIILHDSELTYLERLQPFLAIVQYLKKEISWQNWRTHAGEPYLSFLVVTEAEAQRNQYVFLDMVAEAIILKDTAGFFRTRLEELRHRLQELGSRKIYLANGSWYWDLKPNYQLGEVVTL